MMTTRTRRTARLGLGAGSMLLAGLMLLAEPGEAQRGARVGQPAPEITGGPWINSEPLSMERLRGRVVYVEFWTHG
jgi:hypothetical protein